MSSISTSMANILSMSAVKKEGNDRYGDLQKLVRELGRDSALGKEALPKLAATVCRAAFDRIIHDTPVDEEGNIITQKGIKGRDHVARLYEDYVNAESKKAYYQHSDNGVKANVSKLRTFVKVGMLPGIKGPSVIERAIEIHVEQAKAGTKVKSPYHYLVDVAREQLKPENAEDELTDAVLRDLAAKPEGPGERDAVSKLTAAWKLVEGVQKVDGNENLGKIMKALAAVIGDLGGENPAKPVTKEDKALATLAKANGISIETLRLALATKGANA